MKTIEKRFKAVAGENDFSKVYSVSGFTYPRMPVLTNTTKDKIQFYNWGLIPYWIKDYSKANETKKYTLNARAESIFEKPSFKNSILQRRCIIPATGYFEWYHVNKKKYPYYIFIPSSEIFSFAGIWDVNEIETGKQSYTFSIITVKADSYIEKIHNTKKRMPLILGKKDERRWLNKIGTFGKWQYS